MNITTIILIVVGVAIAAGLTIFSWRFENVSNISDEDSPKDSKTTK